MLRRWLGQPHVREWWGNPDEEIGLIAFGKQVDGTEGFVIQLNDAPIGYIQSWIPSQFDNEDWERDLGPLARGIDIFIGAPAALGNGSTIIQAFAQRLMAQGHRHLVIDPDKRNRRAIQAYEKAGFVRFAETGESILMEWRPSVSELRE